MQKRTDGLLDRYLIAFTICFMMEGQSQSKLFFAKSQDWPAEMFRHNVLQLGGGTFSSSFSERKENIFDGRCTAQI